MDFPVDNLDLGPYMSNTLQTAATSATNRASGAVNKDPSTSVGAEPVDKTTNNKLATLASVGSLGSYYGEGIIGQNYQSGPSPLLAPGGAEIHRTASTGSVLSVSPRDDRDVPFDSSAGSGGGGAYTPYEEKRRVSFPLSAHSLPSDSGTCHPLTSSAITPRRGRSDSFSDCLQAILEPREAVCTLYDLSGVVCHTGSLTQGHYISYIRHINEDGTQWVK